MAALSFYRTLRAIGLVVKNDRFAFALHFFGGTSPFPRMLFTKFHHDAHPRKVSESRGMGAKEKGLYRFFPLIDAPCHTFVLIWCVNG